MVQFTSLFSTLAITLALILTIHVSETSAFSSDIYFTTRRQHQEQRLHPRSFRKMFGGIRGKKRLTYDLKHAKSKNSTSSAAPPFPTSSEQDQQQQQQQQQDDQQRQQQQQQEEQQRQQQQNNDNLSLIASTF